MTTRARVYAFLGVLATAGGGWWGNEKYGWIKPAQAKDAKKDDKKKSNEPEAVPVELAAVTQGQITARISASGNLRAIRDVALATQAEGMVRKVAAEEGDFVNEGQVLCQLDERPIRIRIDLTKEKLQQAKSQLDKAKLREDKAKVQMSHYDKEYERYRAANQQGLISEVEADRRKLQRDEFLQDMRIASSEIRELTHRVGELESEIAQAELDLSRTELKAPFSGFITRRSVEVGQRARTLETLFNLGSFSPLQADVFLSEREAHQVRQGQPVSVRLGADGAAAANGRVLRLSPVVDQASGTVKVTIELQPVGRDFRPGAFVRVDIRTDTRANVLLIPKRAVIEEDGESYVYVATGEKAARTKVATGYEDEGVIEVRTGIREGQKVVVAGQGALKEGSRVKVTKG